MSSVSAVLFDLDNTLYDNNEELEEWARDSACRLLSREQATAVINSIPDILKSIGAQSKGSTAIASQISTVVPQLNKTAVQFLEAMYHDWIVEMHLRPDASRVLDALDSAGVPFGIVTNAPAFQLIKIAALGLNTRVKCVLISELYGAEKPDQAIFLAAAEAIGSPCDQILFVGDSPNHDVIGAHNAGMMTAWLRRGRNWPAQLEGHEPDFVLDDLMETIGIIRSR